MSKHILELTDVQVYALYSTYGDISVAGPYIPLPLQHTNVPENIPFMLEAIKSKLEEIEEQETRMAQGDNS